MKLLVIILNYRVADLTAECLRSLSEEIPAMAGAQVTVVENGSGDNSEARLHEAIRRNNWSHWVELVTLSHNSGFTGGNNVVIRRAMAAAEPPDYILLLNADTVVERGALRTLVQFMEEHPEIGIAGSRLIFPDGRPQGSPFRFVGIASEFDRGLGIGIVSKLLRRWGVCPPKPSTAAPVDWVAGAAMIIRRQVIEAIGPLDEGYFAYFDDIDYCLNAKRAGWSTWYVPDSLVLHHEGSSSGIGSERERRPPDYWFKARRRFFLKNYGVAYSALIDLSFLIGCVLGRIRRMLQGKPSSQPSHLLRDSIRHSVFCSGIKVDNITAEVLAV